MHGPAQPTFEIVVSEGRRSRAGCPEGTSTDVDRRADIINFTDGPPALVICKGRSLGLGGKKIFCVLFPSFQGLLRGPCPESEKAAAINQGIRSTTAVAVSL